MVKLQFPDVLFHKQAFGLRVKIGYLCLCLERGMPLVHHPVWGDVASINIHVNTTRVKLLLFAGFGFIAPLRGR